MEPIRNRPTRPLDTIRNRRRIMSVVLAIGTLVFAVIAVQARRSAPHELVRSTRSESAVPDTGRSTDPTTVGTMPGPTSATDQTPLPTMAPDNGNDGNDDNGNGDNGADGTVDTFPPVVDTGPDAGLADPNVFVDLLPDLRSMPAPDWVTLGTRLTYYASAASVPGSFHEYVEDENGGWINPETGDRYDQVDIPGAAGHGYNQVTITELNSSVAVLSVRAYGLNDLSLDSSVRTISWGGTVGIPGAGADYWLHPAVLDQVDEVVTSSLKVVRMPYWIGGTEYSTIWVQSIGETSNLTWVYDTDSGMLLHTASSTIGPPITGPVVEGEGRTGSTFLTQSTFVGVRGTELPWATAAPPSWLGSVDRIDYSGSITVGITGNPAAVLDAWLTVERRMSGTTWGRYVFARTMSTDVTPSVTEYMERIDGPGQVGALWIPPDALSWLTAGQDLDWDPITRTAVSVSSVDPGLTVTIVEVGPGEESELVYDVASGLLISSSTTDLHLGTRVEYEFVDWS